MKRQRRNRIRFVGRLVIVFFLLSITLLASSLFFHNSCLNLRAFRLFEFVRIGRVNLDTQQQSNKPRAFAGVTWYHWAVVIIATMGWMFDCMDQRFFVLVRSWAMQELLQEKLADDIPEIATLAELEELPMEQRQRIERRIQSIVNDFSSYATTAMILGWATGGIVFGLFSDRYGRVKTMAITLIFYTAFTGVSGLSISWIDFIIYRFFMGMGVGGMFAAATTLVAESVPPGFRAIALGALQSLSAMGNVTGSLISFYIPPGAQDFWMGFAGWRVLCFVGFLPIVLLVPILVFLREPTPWLEARRRALSGALDQSTAKASDLYSNPRWRKNLIIGLLFGFAGMAALWGVGFFSPELISFALAGHDQAVVDRVRALGTMLQDIGAFFGMMFITVVAANMGRRIAFLLSFLLAMGVTIFVFLSLKTPSDAYWMLPMMGFAQLAVFACYSIYFPELFPSRLRGTGVGLCYNTVRYLAAPVPILMMQLALLLQDAGVTEYFRWAAVILSSVYLVGMAAIIWAPETKGQPLPED